MHIRTSLFCIGFLFLSGCAISSYRALSLFPAPSPTAVLYDPTQVVSTPEDTFQPSTSAASPHVLIYVANVAGNVDIYTQQLGRETQPRRLTHHSTDDTSPALSPDGKHIAWVAQADDVKGDIWIMRADGSQARRLTDRSTSDDAPAWSPDGHSLYFSSRTHAHALPGIDRVNVHDGTRTHVVETGWDPALSPDGQVMVYAAIGTLGLPQLFAMHLPSERIIPLTEGRFVDGFPHIYTHPQSQTPNDRNNTRVIFTRYSDDHNDDGRIDTQDTPSLWAMPLDPRLFDGANSARTENITGAAYPLTAGEHKELFPAHLAGWMLYTSDPLGDMDIYALPVSGMVNPHIDPRTLLQTAQAQSRPALKRLLLRFIVATAPDMADEARYALARDLAERGKYNEAIAELQQVTTTSHSDILKGVASIEIERLKMLQLLDGMTTASDAGMRAQITHITQSIERIAQQWATLQPVALRKTTSLAEATYALGQQARAVNLCRSVQTMQALSPEDGARCIALRGMAHAAIGDTEGFGLACVELQQRFPHETPAIERCVTGWIGAIQQATETSPRAELEAVLSAYPDLQMTVAKAGMALADALVKEQLEDSAADVWRHVITHAPQQRGAVAQALWFLADYGTRMHDIKTAMPAFERLLAEFADFPEYKDKARNGVIHISLQQAMQLAASNDLAGAMQAYKRLLSIQPDVVIAHRHYIDTAARLGQSDAIIAEYRRATARQSRNKVYRFAYGYALTYRSPLPWRQAYAEIQASITMDPRFAAAHITRGWLAMQRERRQPNQGWLEAALDSFETARDLLEPRQDKDLLAAVQLNRGNALAALGKTDAAFGAYLERALSTEPFADPMTEMLFYESFARVSWAQGYNDVALDSANRAYALASAIHTSQPRQRGHTPQAADRRTRMIALRAALYLHVGMPKKAVVLYQSAITQYTAAHDWKHLVPMLRGYALALQRSGDQKASIAALQQLLRILADGKGPGKPVPPGRSWIYNQEDPAVPNNVTRGIYGFSSQQEEDIANAQASHVLVQEGDQTAAYAFSQRRLQLLLQAANDSVVGPRIQPELLHAWHDAALIDARMGQVVDAQHKWQQALRIIQVEQYWTSLLPILQSLSHLWLRHPEQHSVETMRDAERVAGLALDAVTKTTVKSKKDLPHAFARWLALHNYMLAMQPPPGLALGSNQSHRELTTHLKAVQLHLDKAVVTMETAQQYAGIAGGDVLEMRLHGSDHSVDTAHTSVTSGDGSILHFLRTGDLDQAWQQLERNRLAQLAVPEQRIRLVQRREFRQAWDTVQLLRDNPAAYAKAVNDAPALLRAIAGQPIARNALQQMLAVDNATFLQVFPESPSTWHWFVISGSTFKYIATPAQPSPMTTLPQAVVEACPSSASVIYVDAGDLFVDLSQSALSSFSKVYEVLSATYAVAAYEQRNLGPHNGAPLHLTMPSHADLDAWNPNRDQVTFTPRDVTHARRRTMIESSLVRFDLNDIAALDTSYALAVIDHPPTQPRALRALTQALLLAGIPTVQLAASSTSQRHTRMLGYVGMTTDQQVTFAAYRLWRLIGEGIQAIKEARTISDTHTSHPLYQRAAATFESILDTIAFLHMPMHQSLLATSTDTKLSRLTPTVLTTIEISGREQLAEAYSNAHRIDDAIAQYSQIIGLHTRANNTKGMASAHYSLGNVLMRAQRVPAAIDAFSQCISATAIDAIVQARCFNARASARRGAYDYPGAMDDYQHAIALHAQAGQVDVIDSRRFLGFLYESALNDYDAALDVFNAALADAIRLKQDDRRPRILLDISRIYRQQGNYTLATQHGTQAEQLLLHGAPSDRAEADLELAKIAWYQGDYAQAHRRQSTALQHARDAGDKFREIQAISLAGLIALNQGDLTNAEVSVRDALHLSELNGLKTETAAQLNNLGIIVRESGRYTEALTYFERAQDIDAALGSLEGRAFDLRHIGITQHKLGNATAAQQALDDALALSRKIGHRYNELQCLLARGDVMETLERHQDATDMYQAAHTLAQHIHLNEALWRALYGLGRMAIARNQRATGRLLYDQAIGITQMLVRKAAVESTSTTPDTLISDAIKAALLDNDADAAFRYITQGRATSPHRTQSDALASDTHTAPSFFYPLAETQQNLPKDTALLAYFVGPTAAYGMFIRASDAVPFAIETPTPQLLTTARTLTERINAFAPVDTLIRQLSTMLVAPIPVSVWSGSDLRHLVILSDPLLRAVPFAALTVSSTLGQSKQNHSEPQPLLTHVSLSQSPSVVSLMQQLQQPAPKPTRTFGTLLADSAADLPFARLEIDAITAEHPGTIGATSTTTQTLDVDALDVVGHNDGDERNFPLLQHPPQLVALSACNTALPWDQDSETTANGLATLYLRGGTRTVVASLGRVSDLATSVTIKRFFRLLPHHSPAEALQKAALLTRTYFSHPAHWALFTLFGDPR